MFNIIANHDCLNLKKNGLKALKSNSVVQRATSKLKLEIAMKEQKKMEDKDSKKRCFQDNKM
jgi:hypothetical protein